MSISQDTSSTSTTAAAATPVTGWSSVDDAFFRIVARVFSPEFLEGAGTLLGTYDPEL